MAVIAGNICSLMPAYVPVYQMSRFSMTSQASGRLFHWAHFFAVGKNGYTLSTAFLSMSSPGPVARFTPLPICRTPRNSLFGVD